MPLPDDQRYELIDGVLYDMAKTCRYTSGDCFRDCGCEKSEGNCV